MSEYPFLTHGFIPTDQPQQNLSWKSHVIARMSHKRQPVPGRGALCKTEGEGRGQGGTPEETGSKF